MRRLQIDLLKMPSIFLIQDHFRFFLPSRSSNLVFSNIMISPSFNSATAASNSTPLVAGTNLTGCPNNSANLSATGLKDF